MKRLSILGSTGSIGRSCLDVVRQFPQMFEVLSLTAGRNVDLLQEQIEEFSPSIAVLGTKDAAEELKGKFSSSRLKVLWGIEGLIAASTLTEADLVVSAITGAAGLMPTFAAIKAGKDVALANKESLVIGGEILINEAAKRGCRILPVDSEHSAVFQAVQGHKREDIRRIILTASGGPFLGLSIEDMENVAPEDALSHPRWVMGRRITIDSATLMNKGFEVIEARWLFGIETEKISVCIHPESIIHSMVEYKDKTIIAQMAFPDMQGPIAYALNYPERLDIDIPSVDFSEIKTLTFETPDEERFPCLKLAYQALKEGGVMPVVLNASDEVAVEAFLEGRIVFTSIPKVIQDTMEHESPLRGVNIEEILEVDRWARAKAEEVVKGYEK